MNKHRAGSSQKMLSLSIFSPFLLLFALSETVNLLFYLTESFLPSLDFSPSIIDIDVLLKEITHLGSLQI